MIKELFPTLYWYLTRQRNPLLLFYDFFLCYILPILFIIHIDVNSISSFLPLNYFTVYVFWLGFISVYEIGYVQNDFYSIHIEEKPSLKTSSLKKSDIIKFVLIRLIVFIFCVSLLFLLTNNTHFVCSYIIFTTLIFTIFSIHNTISYIPLRVITFFLLNLGKIFIFSLFGIISGRFPFLLFPFGIIMALYRLLIYVRKKDIIMAKMKDADFAYPPFLIILFLSIIVIDYITTNLTTVQTWKSVVLYIFFILTIARLLNKMKIYKPRN